MTTNTESATTDGRGMDVLDAVEGEKPLTCTVIEGPVVNPCQWLEKMTQYGHPSGKQRGIFCWDLTNLETGKRSRRFFGAKSGDQVEKGLIFNYCPYCGKRIDGETDTAS